MIYMVVFEEDVCWKAIDDVRWFIRKNCKTHGSDLEECLCIECDEEIANDIEEMYGVEQVLPMPLDKRN